MEIIIAEGAFFCALQPKLFQKGRVNLKEFKYMVCRKDVKGNRSWDIISSFKKMDDFVLDINDQNAMIFPLSISDKPTAAEQKIHVKTPAGKISL